MSSSRAFTYMHLAHVEMIEKLHAQFLQDPMSVDPSWRYFFEGVEFGQYQKAKEIPSAGVGDLRVYHLIDAYRKFGHLQAHLNPIATQPPQPAHELTLSSLNFEERELDSLSRPTAFSKNPWPH